MIVSFNTSEMLKECLTAVYQLSQSLRTEVIVVDNASTDGSAEMVHNHFPEAHLMSMDSNLGFGVANNIGVAAATSPHIMLLNSDAILLNDVGIDLVSYLTIHPEVACVAPRVLLPSGISQPKVYGNSPNAWRVWMQSLGINRLFPNVNALGGIDGIANSSGFMEVGWLSGVCMLMRRQDYIDVSGFDVRFFMYCEDIDLCVRLQKHAGKLVIVDQAKIKHYGGASSKTIKAKVRNAVWQQQHLMVIIKEQCGYFSGILSSIAIILGMSIRLLAGLVLIPKSGFKKNEALQMAWARLIDIFKLHSKTKRHLL